MQLGRFQVSTLRPAPILSVSFSHDGRMFAVATEHGYEAWRTWPLGLLRRRDLPGTLALAVPLPYSPLLVLQGGGSNPLFPPNKAVIYHDALGTAVGELEFGERIRGIAVRYRTIVVVLLHRVVVYEYGLDSAHDTTATGSPMITTPRTPSDTDVNKNTNKGSFWLAKMGEWETAENEFGLTALSTTPGSTLLALLGRQVGHVQLVHLPPCQSPPLGISPTRTPPTVSFRSPIILAHTHALSSLACTATGAHLVTTSERGTLLRVWDMARGGLDIELRRGVDRAEIWGVAFEDTVFADKLDLADDSRRQEHFKRKGGRIVGWSDKGTVHVWGTESSTDGATSSTPSALPSLTNMLAKTLPLPKYFSSSASHAQYHLPRKNPHAFSSAIGAAADAAGVPSMRINEDGDREPEEREWAEHYVVGWIEVEVDDDKAPVPSGEDDKFRLASATAPTSTQRRPLDGLMMGTREERRSFGSDATSTRTATPSLTSRRGAETPTPGSTAAGLRDGERRLSSGSAKQVARKGRKSEQQQQQQPMKKTRLERQLVVITYSGDWYRLRIPRGDSVDDVSEESSNGGKKSGKGKCELVEYRRLAVGGVGW